MRKSSGKPVLCALSVFMMIALFFGIVVQPVSASVHLLQGLRPTFDHPQAAQHTPTFRYAKSPLLRMPQVFYETPDALEEEYGLPVAEGEYETVYQTGEDTYKTVVDTVPHAYVDEEGQLVPIDNTLALTTAQDGSEVFTNTANLLQVEMPVVISEGEGVSVSLGNDQARLIPTEGDYSRAAAQGDSVLYNDVFPGIDVQYTAHEVALKEFIILRSATEKHTFQYRLSAAGMEVRAEGGAINLYKLGDEMPTFTIAAPLMYDAAGAYSFDVGITLEGDIVTVWANPEWLAAPERVYPVEIDPSVIETKRATASMLTVGQSFYHNTVSYSMAGYIPKNDVGYPGDSNWAMARAMFYFSDALTGIPTDAIVEEARFVLNQYNTLNGSGNNFEVFQLDSSAFYTDIDTHPGYTNHWDFLMAVQHHFVGSFTSSIKAHTFDVTDTVSNWLAGVENNYGLMVKAADSGTPPAALFYSPSVSDPATKPRLEIDWREAGSVPPTYGLDATTVHVRPISDSGTGGQLDFYGVFWDGLATPGGEVVYVIKEGSTSVVSAQTDTDPMYVYPNTADFEQLPGYPSGGTKYRRKLSNWQTNTPFTTWEQDTLYTLTAYAQKDGQQGASVTSESFLVYKVKQFDTLTSIANWYGVPYTTLAKDNRIVDRLLVEGNTIFIRNPQRNADTPYNPPDLKEDAQREIDGLLMGRGLHCEFGYEPINLNTGNFVLEATDVSAEDFGGTFAISRFYNSIGAAKNSMFGRGWAFNWDEKLSAMADGTIVYARGDGSILRFKPNGSGGYDGPAGYGLTLARTLVRNETVDFGTEDDPDEIISPIYSYTITGAEGTVRTFDAFGLLVKSVDIDGFATELEYDAEFKLARIVAPSGLAYTITTDSIGRITAVGLPGGGQLHYVYSTNGDLVSYIDATGKETTYSYDAKHHMSGWTDANGTQIIANEYDVNGRVTKQTDGRGEVVVFAYAAGQTSITDMRGFITTYQYDSQYRTTKIEYPDGTVEENGYNAHNQRSFSVNALGQRTEYAYDAAGNVTKITRHDGAVQIFEFDSANRQTKFTDWDSSVTQSVYDINGDLVKTIFPDGTENTFAYDADHRMLTQTDALGSVTRYEWSGALQSAVVDPLGNRTQTYYDAFGRVTSTVDAEGGISRTTYDAAGRLLGEQDADGNLTEYVYDDAGRCIAILDPLGHRTDFVYDDMDNLIEITDALGNKYKFTYDATGNKLTERGPLGATITRTYDTQNRILTETSADGGITTYTYDAAGRIRTQKNPLGGITTYEYDPVSGYQAKIIDTAGGVTTMQYDLMGRVSQITDANGGVETTTYDNRGRTQTHTDTLGLVTTYFYDAAGRLLKTQDALGRQTNYIYDAAGRQVEVVAADGAATKTKYDKTGRAVVETNALGGERTTKYSPAGQVLSVADEMGNITTYTYDAGGNKTSQTDARGNTTEYEYDPLKRQVLERDALGGETQTVYDAAGNPVIVRDVFGNESRYEFSAQGYPTKTTDALGNVSECEYDAAGNQSRVTAANGSVTSYVYDKSNRLVKTITPAGLVTQCVYDAAGNLIQQSNSLGEATQNTYNSAGLLVETKNAVGQVARYEYDAAGQQVKSTGFEGLTTQTDYDNRGRAAKSIDAAGHATLTTYDALGRVVQTTDAFGRVWKYTYDALGRRLAVTDPLGNVSTSEYDKNGNATKQTDALGGVVIVVYDALNRAIKTTDANGNTTLTTYDAAGRVVKSVAADGGVTEYQYDAVGNVIKEMDALNNITQYTYDSLGSVLTMKTPMGGVFTYVYDIEGCSYRVTDPLGNSTQFYTDAAGNMTKQVAADGGTTTTANDAIGRVTETFSPEQGGMKVFYDARGNVNATVDSLGRTTTNGYDALNRLVSVTNPAGGVTQYTYDIRGNVASITTAKGLVTRYTYDLLDRVAGETNAMGGVTTYTYDALGRQSKLVEPGGATTETAYDAMGNTIGVKDALGNTHGFVYDSMNRLVSETDTMGGVTRYEYDRNGQLTKQTDALGKISTFDYDKNGNMVGNAGTGSYRSQYEYDAVGNLIRVTDGIQALFTYTYDAMGRLAAKADQEGNTWQYAYNHAGSVTRVTDPLQNVQKYEYDPLNRLIKSVGANGAAVEYGYDANGNLNAKTYGGAQTNVAYLYDADGNLTRMRDASGESVFVYDALNRLLLSTNGQGGSVWYEYTAAGDLGAMVYPDGSRVTYSYDLLHHLTGVKGREGQTLTYTYNKRGEVTAETWQDGSGSVTKYDALGHVTHLVNKAADGSVLSEYAYEYNDVGNIIKETATQNGATLVRQYGYTDRGQLASVREEGASWLYKYDSAGNRIFEEEVTAQGTHTTSYSYNAAGHLVKSNSNKAGETTYQYDANGNLTLQTSREAVTAYAYTAENQISAVRENGTLLMASLYDGLGNRTYQLTRRPASQGAYIITQSTWKRVAAPTTEPEGKTPSSSASSSASTPTTSISASSSVPLPPPPIVEGNDSLFWYGFWQGVYRLSAGANQALATERGEWLRHNWPESVTTHPTPPTPAPATNWEEPLPAPGEPETLTAAGLTPEEVAKVTENAPTKWVKVTKENETPSSHWMVYTGTWYVQDVTQEHVQVLAQEDGRGGITDIYTYGVGRLTHEKPGQATRYAYDGRGSVSQTLSGRAVTQTLRYSPYGEVLQGGDNWTPFYGYNAEEHNPETGLQYLRARFYAPSLAAFTTRDTVGGVLHQPLTQNTYLYTSGDPVNYSDPSGHSWLSNAWNAVKNVATTVVNTVKSAASTVVNTVKNAATSIVNAVSTAAKKVVNNATTAASNVVNNVIKPAVNTVSSAIKNTVKEVANSARTMVQEAIDFAREVVPKVIQKGETIFGTVVDMLVHTAKELTRQFCSVLASHAQATKKLLGKNPWLQSIVSNHLDKTDRSLSKYIDTAKLGGFALMMEQDSNGIYHARVDCWQQHMGYNDFYDTAFSAGTNALFAKYPFEYNGESYIFWAWKGDYINMGAGAELGIYYGKDENGHWQIDTGLALPMSISMVQQNGTVILPHYSAVHWWITGFNPKYKDLDPASLTATYTIDFTGKEGMMRAFTTKWAGKDSSVSISGNTVLITF